VHDINGFMLTIFGLPNAPIEALKQQMKNITRDHWLRYYKISPERGVLNGLVHYQCYLQTWVKMKSNAVLALLGLSYKTCHIQRQFCSAQECDQYIDKSPLFGKWKRTLRFKNG